MVNDANDKDGVAEAGDMSEEDEDHVGCNGEGCPNKCALGVDCGHVEEAGEDCGGVGHDVGGVVHGYIAQMEREKNRCRSFHKQIQFLNLEIVRCANPGPCSGQP